MPLYDDFKLDLPLKKRKEKVKDGKYYADLRFFERTKALREQIGRLHESSELESVLYKLVNEIEKLREV